eukprot:TRINITY_DN13389_c3_g2_i1.p1 TRINITY_DN13389_c3_g2~~TRINITY_DN13389_c3_g2_i1.p1  ORF type:complete len:173 (+),score=33.06 TRINITY_DN13389_c3_g2_i1:330-848(+)
MGQLVQAEHSEGQKQADTPTGSPELLIDGARYDDEEDVRAAIDVGTNVNCSDWQGRTGLHMAAANGHSAMVQLLLSLGANANSRNEEQNTPLHYAALNGHHQVVEALMASDADPCALNRYERTPMDEAIGKNHTRVMEAINAGMVAREASRVNLNEEIGEEMEESIDDVPHA